MLKLIFSSPQLIIFILALWQRKNLSFGMKLIAVQALVSLGTDILAFLCIEFWGITNAFVYNIYMVAEFLLIAAAFESAINSPRIKSLIRTSLFLIPAFALYTYTFADFFRFNYLVLTVSFLILSIINLVYLIFPDLRVTSNDGLFPVSIGHVIYFLGVTPYFVGRELIIENSPDLADVLFDYINNALAMCRYGFIIFGFISLSIRKA